MYYEIDMIYTRNKRTFIQDIMLYAVLHVNLNYPIFFRLKLSSIGRPQIVVISYFGILFLFPFLPFFISLF